MLKKTSAVLSLLNKIDEFSARLGPHPIPQNVGLGRGTGMQREFHTRAAAQRLRLHRAPVVGAPQRLFQQQHLLHLDVMAGRHAVEIDACGQLVAVITFAVPFDRIMAD